MAMSFSRSDPASPAQVADASFSTSRRGFDQGEVREFLRMVSAEMARMSERIRFLEREVDAAQTSPEVSARLDEDTLTRLLGEETARVLSAARTSATEIRQKAEQAAGQLVAEASDEASRIRTDIETEAVRLRADAAADAEAELEMAKQQGREMVNEARAYRERVLSELARRRELAREQIEQLLHGRDRLLEVFERARVAAVDVVAELEPIGQPDEYVNLSPTTGPVPVMVAREAVASPDTDRGAPTSDPVETTDAAEAGDAGDADVADADVELVASDAADTPDGDADAAAVVEVIDAADATDTSEVDETADETADRVDATEADAAADTVEVADDTIDPVEAADEGTAESPDDVVVDLFARLRNASETDTELDDEPELESGAADTDTEAAAEAGAGIEAEVTVLEMGDADGAADSDSDADTADDDADTADDEASDAFSRRDAELTPLIVASARKLKRVLADEQNDVLDTLRRTDSITGLDELVADHGEHGERYLGAVSDDLLLGAQAGAAGTDDETVVKLSRSEARACVTRAGEQLTERLVKPLRDRLDRAVVDSDGDADVLAKKVRAVYREVKTRVIDEVLDDVFRTAYGAGVSAAIAPGIPVVWMVDPRHPTNPDCYDNSLSPAVPHGESFPTGDVTAPAHPGCRCMLQISGR